MPVIVRCSSLQAIKWLTLSSTMFRSHRVCIFIHMRRTLCIMLVQNLQKICLTWNRWISLLQVIGFGYEKPSNLFSHCITMIVVTFCYLTFLYTHFLNSQGSNSKRVTVYRFSNLRRLDLTLKPRNWGRNDLLMLTVFLQTCPILQEFHLRVSIFKQLLTSYVNT